MQGEETTLPTCSGATSSQRLRARKGRCRRACRYPVQKESVSPDHMQAAQFTRSAFPALSFSKIDEFQVKEIQIMACAYLPEVWACCGHILVLCRVPSPGLLSRVCKHTKRPVVRLLVVALRHLRTHRTSVNVRLRQGRMRSYL